MPFWLVFLALIWAFVLSMYVETMRFSANLRGYSGLGISVVSVLFLASLTSGLGLAPMAAIIRGDAGQAFTLIHRVEPPKVGQRCFPIPSFGHLADF